MATQLPVIDVGPLVSGVGDPTPVGERMDAAAREFGFFYVVEHGVDPALEARLLAASRRFFALPDARKREIRMARGGPAWRGYFPVGDELTSGLPDQKEGIYFGAELGPEHPAVARGTPLHGPNLFPAEIPELREAVLAWIAAQTRLGHALMTGFALGLGLEPSWFASRYTADPLVLFRIFHYPALPVGGGDEGLWSVGRHSDYGLLTMLLQTHPGLQVQIGERWIDAPPIPSTFVCNVGDMLDRMSAGRYRSALHRVRNESGETRLSFPFFFDPAFDARVRPIEGLADGPAPDADRWDGVDVHAFDGSYGDYLLGKISRVFPRLGDAVL